MPDPTLDLKDVLDRALLAEYNSWPKAMKIWPSDLGDALGHEHGGCQLAFWHKCRDAERVPPSPGEVLMFKMGDLAEEYLIGLLERHLPAYGWRVIGKQTRCEVNGISGRLDVEIEHIESGARIVVDMKTKRGNAFKFLTEAKPGNVLQVQDYVAARDASAGALVYADREGQNGIRAFPVGRDDDRPARAVAVLTGIRDNPVPPAGVKLKLARRVNKGPDAVYLNIPWQIDWCDLKECACKKALPGNVPDAIVAKIGKDGKVVPQEGMEKWMPTVLQLLAEQFPDEVFTW